MKKLIYIEWADAHTKTGWCDEAEVKEFCDDGHFIIKEAGWLIEETLKHIVISTGFKEETSYWQEQMLNLHKIPKTWIKKRRDLTKYIK